MNSSTSGGLRSAFLGPADPASSRLALGVVAFFVLIGAVIAYFSIGSRGVYTNFFLLYAALFGFACALVATLVNALAPRGSDPGPRAGLLWGTWVVLAIAGSLAIPLVMGLCDRYAWKSLGTVTAAIGMSVTDVRSASTATLYEKSGDLEPNFRHGGVVALHVANTPTTFARCWLFDMKAADAGATQVSYIHARIAPDIGSYAAAARVLDAARAKLLADGWKDGPAKGYVSHGDMAIGLLPKRLDRENDPDRPDGIWSADVTIGHRNAI